MHELQERGDSFDKIPEDAIHWQREGPADTPGPCSFIDSFVAGLGMK